MAIIGALENMFYSYFYLNIFKYNSVYNNVENIGSQYSIKLCLCVILAILILLIIAYTKYKNKLNKAFIFMSICAIPPIILILSKQ